MEYKGNNNEEAAALVHANGRARAAAQRRAYVARMLREFEADDFPFVDDTTYEFLVAQHVGNYSTRLLLQWQVAELMHVNARYYNTLRGNNVKRRVGALSLPNERRSLERRYAAAYEWNVELLGEFQVNQAAAWTTARVKEVVQ